MLKGKEQKTGENNNSKPMGKGFFVVGCVIIYFLIVGIVSAAIHLPVAITKISDNSEIKKAKVVLYDGPKSLKDATDADLEKDITFFLSGHHVKLEECMLLATDPEEVAWAKKETDSDSDQLTIIGYEVPDFSKQMPLSNVDMLLLGLEEVCVRLLLIGELCAE